MNKKESDKLMPYQCLAYALPMTLTYFLFYPVQILLAGIYAKYYGVALSTLAVIVFSARLFDALIDPLIGYISDRHRAKIGTRKPWLIVGSLGLVITSYFLWPPEGSVSTLYLVGWYFTFYFAWTVADIPHIAWGGELAACGQIKTQIYSIRTACVFLGQLLFTITPLLPFLSSKGFTPETLRWSILMSTIVMLPTVFVCVKFTPNGRKSINAKKENAKLLIKAIVQNSPLLILLAGFFPVTFSYGLYLSLSFIFADTYLGIEAKLPIIFALATTMGVIAAVAVYKLSERFSKVAVYSAAIIMSGISFACIAQLDPENNPVTLFTLLTCMIYFANAIVVIIVPSILSDISDYGTWKFGTDRAATYFSVYSFMVKSVGGVGGAFGLWMIGVYGFDATETVHTDSSVMGLKLAISFLPAILMSVSLLAIVKTPLNASRHHTIRRRLALRLERENYQQLYVLKEAKNKHSKV